MANEFQHLSVGTSLTQAEFEATDGTGHILNSQATGDIIYASSSSVLSRLGVGATNNTLQVVGGVPAWVASPTFVNVTLTSFASNWTNAGRTVADAGILTTVDINGGTLGGVTADGAIRFNDNVLLTFGTTDGTDADLSYNGSALVLRLNTSPFEVHADSGYGYIYIRDAVTGLTAGNGMRIGFNGGVARIHNYENTAMEFYNNGTKVWEFTNAGVLKANGAKSITTSTGNLTLDPEGEVVTTKGINFPDAAVASADANTLDDYEEGTWTPAAVFSGGNGDLSYGFQNGTYTKVGRLVTIQCTIRITETTASGNLTITGVPFTNAATLSAQTGAVSQSAVSMVGGLVASLVSSGTTVTLLYANTGDFVNVSSSNTGTNTTFGFIISYNV